MFDRTVKHRRLLGGRQPVSREQADAFAKKVERKGKNALGLIVSLNEFSEPGA